MAGPGRFLNSLTMKVAGHRRFWSKLTHYGRTSGRTYTTVLSAYPLGDGFVMGLFYGSAKEIDWSRNLLSTGRCQLVTAGHTYLLGHPEMLSPEQALKAYPPLMRLLYSRVKEFIWVHPI